MSERIKTIYTLIIKPISERHVTRSLPAARHSSNGIMHILLTIITQKVSSINDVIAAITCIVSSFLSNTFAPPQIMTQNIPAAATHMKLFGVISIILGSISICDHKANNSSHLHFDANWDKLSCVPHLLEI